MGKTLNLIKSDLKNIIREPIFFVLLLAPTFMVLILKFVFPYINLLLNRYIKFDLYAIFPQISFMFLLLIPMLCGMIWSLLLVDDKDNKILDVMSISPLGKSGYINIKLLSSVIFSLILVLLMYIFGEYKEPMSLKFTLLLILISFQSIYLVVLVANFANNKVEAMTFAKIFSFIYLFPLVSLMFRGNLRYLLAIFPQYWVIEAYRMLHSNNFWIIIILGYICNSIYSWVLIKYFKK